MDKELQFVELESSLIRSKADVIFFDEKYKDKILQIKENNNTNVTQYICFNSLDGFHSIDTLIEEGKELLKTGLTNFTDVII